jgi:hypothetical protein
MLVHHVDTVVDHTAGEVLIGGQRLDPDLEPFHDIHGPPRRGRGTDRHVEIDAVVGQKSLE